MANRNFANGGKIYAMHVMPVIVNAVAAIGASGAVSSVSSTMCNSVTHVSTGIYRFNLTDNFNAALSIHASARSPGSGLSGVLCIEVQNAPSTNIASLTAPSITVKCLDAAGALVDPASGSAIDIMIYANNSGVKA